MSWNLRLLLDESVPNDLAEELMQHPSLNVEYARSMPKLKGKGDPVLMKYADETRRIMVTTEYSMNEHSFAICTHPGIIVFANRKRHKDISTDLFQRFMRSGHRQRCHHAVVYLSQGQARIVEADQTETFTI